MLQEQHRTEAIPAQEYCANLRQFETDNMYIYLDENKALPDWESLTPGSSLYPQNS